MSKRPFGYFVHHQGRGHATRCAAVVDALPQDRPVTIFSARDDIFPALPERAKVVRIPSLFEAEGQTFPALDALPTPGTMHCAPVGWPTISHAVATLTTWFAEARPDLFVVDVSAEIAQLARIASVPAVKIVQHGDRTDPGHRAAYEGCVGLLAPWAESLARPDMPDWMRVKTFFAGGLGAGTYDPDKVRARRRLGIGEDEKLAVVISGGGGLGFPSAPLTMAARARSDIRWVTLGKVQTEWHETPPGNLDHRGWVDDPETWIAAADLVLSSAGNTTVQMIASIRRPWIVIPEWRYFDEQMCKATRLHDAGAAIMASTWPGAPGQWTALIDRAMALDPDAQACLTDTNAAPAVADWLEDLSARLWHRPETPMLEAAE